MYITKRFRTEIDSDSILIDGVTWIKDVGIKYKGNSSYNINNTKNPFNIKNRLC